MKRSGLRGVNQPSNSRPSPPGGSCFLDPNRHLSSSGLKRLQSRLNSLLVVSSLFEQRAARNESLFREVNENIAELEASFGATSEPVYMCECANTGCAEQLSIHPKTYARVRSDGRLFFVLPGHQDPRIERVVERHRNYLVVEKTGEAGEVAEQTQD